MKIDLDFKKKESKYITKVGLIKRSQKKGRVITLTDYYNLIFDTGCTMTSMSAELFDYLGCSPKDEAKVKIKGINGESDGISSVIEFFEIGGVNIGPVRVAIGKFLPEFENTVILGVNVLMWYDFGVSHSNEIITLVERQFTKPPVNNEDRFTSKNPSSIGLVLDI
jgi:hypothetical protein